MQWLRRTDAHHLPVHGLQRCCASNAPAVAGVSEERDEAAVRTQQSRLSTRARARARARVRALYAFRTRDTYLCLSCLRSGRAKKLELRAEVESAAIKNFPSAPPQFQADMAGVSLEQQAFLLPHIEDRKDLMPSPAHSAKIAGVTGYEAPPAAPSKGNAAALQRTGSLVTTSPAAAAVLKQARTRTPQQMADLRAAAAKEAPVAKKTFISLVNADEDEAEKPAPPHETISLVTSDEENRPDDSKGPKVDLEQSSDYSESLAG